MYSGLVSAHEYPEDEFDELGKDSPGGVHREKPSQWKSVLPFLVVLVLAPLLAWGAASYYTGHKESKPTPTVVASPASTSTHSGQTPATGEPAQSSSPSQAATTQPTDANTPSVKPDFSQLRVEVLNGTGVNGLAAEVAKRVTQLGFENASAANAEGWLAEASTVYYRSGQEAAAEAIAKELNIDLRQENDDAVGDNAVIVLLRDDFQR